MFYQAYWQVGQPPQFHIKSALFAGCCTGLPRVLCELRPGMVYVFLTIVIFNSAVWTGFGWVAKNDSPGNGARMSEACKQAAFTRLYGQC